MLGHGFAFIGKPLTMATLEGIADLCNGDTGLILANSLGLQPIDLFLA